MKHQLAPSLNSSTIDAFQLRIADAWPPRIWTRHKVLIAVSGGPDSVALLRAAHNLLLQERGNTENLAVAHVNHGLRGRDSDQDQEFVEGLAKKLPVPVFSQRLTAKSLTETPPGGIETAARLARYQALYRIAHEIGARYLATGHIQDDQIETVFFRIFRGTGVAGLAGIPTMRRVDDGLTIVRPMLGMRREQVVAYLAALAQDTRCDASNRDADYAARNWIRHELLPVVRAKFGDRIDASIAQLAAVANDYHQFVADQAKPLVVSAVVVARDDLLVLRKDAFVGQPPVLVQAALQQLWDRQGWPQQDMTFDKWRRLVGMLLGTAKGPGESDFPGQIRVVSTARKLHFSRPTSGRNEVVSHND